MSRDVLRWDSCMCPITGYEFPIPEPVDIYRQKDHPVPKCTHNPPHDTWDACMERMLDDADFGPDPSKPQP